MIYLTIKNLIKESITQWLYSDFNEDITEKEFWYVADKYRNRRVWTPSGAKFTGYSPEAQYKLWKLNYLVE